jgi:hypothetical protein
MAGVLKVTANGTTTSPIVRGAWVTERIMGLPVPPPPKAVPAVEPDIRGATTIRQQLAKHTSEPACRDCHVKIDPPGFALEAFDVFGGLRENYRALGPGTPLKGYGPNGQPFTFHAGMKIDPSGVLLDGRKFADIRELKSRLSANDRLLARNLVNQLVTYRARLSVGVNNGRSQRLVSYLKLKPCTLGWKLRLQKFPNLYLHQSCTVIIESTM